MGFIYTITYGSSIYVGSTTKRYKKRWSDHRSQLRNNRHPNIHLQRIYNKYGEDSLVFEVLDEYDNEFLLSAEQYWINMLDSYRNGLNRTPIAGSSTGSKRSEAILAKMRLTKNYLKANEARRGSKHSEETKAIIRQKRATQILPPWTDERRKKASMLLKSTSHTWKRNYNRKCDYYNIVATKGNEVLMFNNTHEAILYLGIKRSRGITRCLRGERNTFKGYSWKAQLKSDEVMEHPEEGNHELSLLGTV